MNPIFLQSEQAEVDAVRFACTLQELNAWFDQSAVKSRFKKECMRLQDLRCCYCRKYSDTINNGHWDLEHVLSESIYPEFFAEDGNLAIACRRCNIAKGRQDVLVAAHPRPPGGLPVRSIHYSIPHPRLDNWATCLSHVNYQIYKSRNDKGTELIKVCKLNEAAIVKARLSYDEVVAAVKQKFFDAMGSDIPTDFRDEDALERITRITEGAQELQRNMQLDPLTKAIEKLNIKAEKRVPEKSVKAAKALAAKNFKKELLADVLKRDSKFYSVSVERAAPSALAITGAPPLLLGNEKIDLEVGDPERE